MKRTLLSMFALTLLLATSTLSLHAQEKDITGTWQGTLEAARPLRILVKISKDDGKLKALMYSIDQGGQPFPATSISLQGSSFNLQIKPLDLNYTGTLNPEGTIIAGASTQGTQTNPLNLEHVTAEAA